MERLFRSSAPARAQVILGCVMLAASFHKIVDPPDFVKILYNYKVFPATWLNPLAIYVPWVEAIAGLALITGLGARGASVAAMGLFTSFIVLLGYNLARGCPTICGCFSTFEAGQRLSVADKFVEMKKEIFLVDVPCLALAAFVFFASFTRKDRES
jgi:uncharacterized membrane protein YphA (DoxX/SURF4 family)